MLCSRASSSPRLPQEQQACMGKLVGQVMQQNEALNAKVAALEHRLAAATTRRENFLWL